MFVKERTVNYTMTSRRRGLKFSIYMRKHYLTRNDVVLKEERGATLLRSGKNQNTRSKNPVSRRFIVFIFVFIA